MKYVFLVLVAVIAIVANSGLFTEDRSVFEKLAIAISNLGLLLAAYAIYVKYWKPHYFRSGGRLRCQFLLVAWFGVVFVGLGTYVGVTKDYVLEGSLIRTVIIREALNALGETLGAGSVAAILIFCGLALLILGIVRAIKV